MKIVRMIKSTKLTPPTFKTWATSLFNYINKLACDVVHLVFDIYPSDIDLSTPCKGRYVAEEAGERRHISSLSQRLPPNHKAWQEYLSNDQNKYELTNLLIGFVSTGDWLYMQYMRLGYHLVSRFVL